MRPVRLFVLLAGALLGLVWPGMMVQPAGAQATSPRVAAVWDAYQALDYAAAADSAEAALQRVDQYTPDELAELHTVLGLIAYSEGRTADASSQFQNALSLDPALELDPLYVSPKILDFFATVRAERLQSRAAEPEAAANVRYVIVEDRRVEAALRSMLVPGWGQLHKGERRKGYLLLGTWSAAAAGTVLTYVQRREAADAYEAATTPDEAMRLYDTYNRWYRLHHAARWGLGALWLAGYVDALVSGAPTSGPPARLTVTPHLSPTTATLRLRVRL